MMRNRRNLSSWKSLLQKRMYESFGREEVGQGLGKIRSINTERRRGQDSSC